MARRKATQRELIEAFFVEYRRAWRKVHGKTSQVEFNNRRAHRVNELIHMHSFQEVVGAVREFVTDKDKWLSAHEHPVDYFLKYPDKFIGRHNGAAERRRRAEAEAARKAERERKDIENFERSLGRERIG